jgi:ABC-2 type transport system permease protein
MKFVGITQSWLMTQRHLMALWRQPWFIGITLVQPIIWLLLFGALFKPVVKIPGFTATNYFDFLIPGIVIMTAVFSSGWNGMGMINDLDRGIVDRFLVSPSKRTPLIVGPLVALMISIGVQVVIIVLLGLAVGANYPGGIPGLLVMLLCGWLLAAALGALSNGVALLARQEETLIGAVTFVTLPLTFMSSAFMQINLSPQWVQDVAKFNPVNWAVVASREALSASIDWGFVLVRMGGLAIVSVVCVFAAQRAFRSYQKSI